MTSFYSQQKKPTAQATLSAKPSAHDSLLEQPAVHLPRGLAAAPASVPQPHPSSQQQQQQQMSSDTQHLMKGDSTDDHEEEQSFFTKQLLMGRTGAQNHVHGQSQTPKSRGTMLYHLPPDSGGSEDHRGASESAGQLGAGLTANGPTAGLINDSPRARPSQEGPDVLSAGVTGSLGAVPRSPIGRAVPGSPDRSTALYASPKRTAGACNEEVIVISPDSQTQEDVEINLLSCSPLKR